jgi:transposase-like protein
MIRAPKGVPNDQTDRPWPHLPPTRVFHAEIIELRVRWYITYRLSYRDRIGMLAERGVMVAHSTILRWVTRYVPEL